MNSPDFVLIQWTCGGLDEARALSRLLVEKRLVACASIIPWVESFYLWDEQLENSQETKVVFKTRKDLSMSVQNELLARSKYDVPEILITPIVDGNPDYLDWIKQTTLERNP